MSLRILLSTFLFFVFSVPVPVRAWDMKFVLGWNHPWAAYGHDFGDAWGHDGVITSGWTYETFPDSRGFTDVRRVERDPYEGRPSLRITADLVGQHQNKSAGEVHLDVSNHPPRVGAVPKALESIDLEGVTVRMRLCLAEGSAGPASARNGIQFFFKTRISDDEFPSLYTEWENIDPSWEGRCVDREKTVSNAGPYAVKDENFDARKVRLVGLKVGINDESADVIQDHFYLQEFALETDTPIVFEFDSLELDQDFGAVRELTQNNFSVSRVFIFTDGRAAPEFNQAGFVKPYPSDADPTSPDCAKTGLNESLGRFFCEDFDELLRVAEQNNVKLMPTFLDFLWFTKARVISGVQVGGRADIARDSAKRASFLDNALRPLLIRYGASPWIHSWDIINEPEWVMLGVPEKYPEEIDPDPVTVQEMQDFIRACVEYVHRYTAHPVTVGSARRKWLDVWRGIGLDFYQFHWYPQYEDEEPFEWEHSSKLGLDRPVIIGEVPTASSPYTAGDFLRAARKGGYRGLLPWSFRAGDRFSDFLAAASDLISRTPRVTADGFVSAASFRRNAAAPGSLVSLFGENLALEFLAAEVMPLPSLLGDAHTLLVDSAGTEWRAPILFVSPGHMSFLIPEGIFSGPAKLTVSRLDGFSATIEIDISRIAPALFSGNADSRGVAAAIALRVGADNSRTSQFTFDPGVSLGSRTPVPIDLRPEGEQVFLILFGTGIRGRSSLETVSVAVGGHSAAVSYAGPHEQFAGLDQVNVGPLSRALIGRDEVSVELTVDGQRANTVTVAFR